MYMLAKLFSKRTHNSLIKMNSITDGKQSHHISLIHVLTGKTGYSRESVTEVTGLQKLFPRLQQSERDWLTKMPPWEEKMKATKEQHKRPPHI